MESETQALVLREALHSDAEILLQWRNDPVTRQHARSQTFVDAEEHIAWLSSCLADPKRFLLIAETLDGSPVGTVRFDFRVLDCTLEVSITVAPEYRGRQQAGALLKIGELWVTQRLGECTFRAFIMPGNPASIRLFERAGYARSPEDAGPHGSWWEKPAAENRD
jgi:RimJ/RimL family protein N-acetyltransferase